MIVCNCAIHMKNEKNIHLYLKSLLKNIIDKSTYELYSKFPWMPSENI